jgi:LysM repeat protein
MNDEIIEEFQGEGLPPRSKVHNTKSNKTKLKIKFPLVRILGLFFILLVLTIISTTIYFKDSISLPSFVEEDNRIYEKIDYAKKQSIKTEMKNEPTEEEKEEDRAPVNNEQPISTDEDSVDSSVQNEEIQTNQNNQQETTNSEYEIRYHTVKANETLYRISNSYYHSRDGEQLIKDWNQLSSNQIYQGQVLKIPIKIENTK